ncbi:hypothetical protein QWY31_13880 [Cytophagales bacterium LB-30]|uniref:Cytochrome C n=1 Tax=Shiella aurantiaca TaxID=3058365 RepID=A0ABT8F887_9BACT|nr:hypothetical protein [Shiella aurantiaca]MDN4166594.1 hypothetical protein [Shiella aurantiaca]
MRNKTLYLWVSAGCFLAACTFSCQSGSKRAYDPNNPYLPSSPLAAVMREMVETLEKEKPSRAKGEFLPMDKDLFHEIKTATPTKASDASLTFYGMADGFLGVLDTYNQSPNQVHYNALIDACVSCHQNFCEGPITRIKKLKL